MNGVKRFRPGTPIAYPMQSAFCYNLLSEPAGNAELEERQMVRHSATAGSQPSADQTMHRNTGQVSARLH